MSTAAQALLRLVQDKGGYDEAKQVIAGIVDLVAEIQQKAPWSLQPNPVPPAPDAPKVDGAFEGPNGVSIPYVHTPPESEYPTRHGRDWCPGFGYAKDEHANVCSKCAAAGNVPGAHAPPEAEQPIARFWQYGQSGIEPILLTPSGKPFIAFDSENIRLEKAAMANVPTGAVRVEILVYPAKLEAAVPEPDPQSVLADKLCKRLADMKWEQEVSVSRGSLMGMQSDEYRNRVDSIFRRIVQIEDLQHLLEETLKELP